MKKIYIIPNRKRPLAVESAERLKLEFESLGATAEITELDESLANGKCSDGDLLVALGGDGTVIAVAGATAAYGVPTAGINCGHVGYMTCMDADDTENIKKLVSGDYTVQKRILLEASVVRDGKEIPIGSRVMNDAVITNGPIPRLLEFDLFANGKFVENFKCDGIIIATPTGSSAYNMSAGGPILDPELNSIIVTPICPQQIGSRPAVFSADAVFEIRNAVCRGNNSVTLSLDGRCNTEIFPSDTVILRKSSVAASLVSLGDKSFLSVLYSKLSAK